MSVTTRVIVSGKSVWYRPMETTQRLLRARRASRKGLEERCPLCKQPIGVGHSIYFVSAGSVLFPNRFVHSDCVDLMGFENAARTLERDYARASQFAHWF